MVRKIADFVLFGSIFIAACAVCLCMETNLQMHLPLNNFSFYCFVFGATLAQYNLHYMTKTRAAQDSERLAWTLRYPIRHAVLLSLGAGLVVFSLFSFHIRHYIILGIMAAIAFVYSFPVLPLGKRRRIKDFGLVKIITLALLWTLVTVWFPVVKLPFDPRLFGYVFFNRFLFMFVLCLLFDVRDIEVDRAQRIHTIPVMTGRERSYQIAYGALFLLAAGSLFRYATGGDPRIPAAMLLSVALTLLTVLATRRSNSDYLYLAGIDGMMLAQPLLVYLAIKF